MTGPGEQKKTLLLVVELGQVSTTNWKSLLQALTERGFYTIGLQVHHNYKAVEIFDLDRLTQPEVDEVKALIEKHSHNGGLI